MTSGFIAFGGEGDEPAFQATHPEWECDCGEPYTKAMDVRMEDGAAVLEMGVLCDYCDIEDMVRL